MVELVMVFQNRQLGPAVPFVGSTRRGGTHRFGRATDGFEKPFDFSLLRAEHEADWEHREHYRTQPTCNERGKRQADGCAAKELRQRPIAVAVF